MFGECSFIELSLLDLRKAASLVEDIGVWHDGEGNRSRGCMALTWRRREGCVAVSKTWRNRSGDTHG